jgi:hypothetical protein
MTDQVKERENKDAESGRPVQLDPEPKGDKSDQVEKQDKEAPQHEAPKR